MNEPTKPSSRFLWMRFVPWLGALALLLVSSHVHAQPTTNHIYIANVYVVGNDSISADKVMAYIHSKPGSEYSFARVQEDVSRLAQAHVFKYIRVKTEPAADGRMNLYFEAKENPNIVKEVIYKHAKHVNLKDLEGLTGIHRGMGLDPTHNRIACYEIQEYLRKEGYLLANVTLEEGGSEQDVRVVFNINEGERLRTQIDTSRAFLGSRLSARIALCER